MTVLWTVQMVVVFVLIVHLISHWDDRDDEQQ